MEKCKVYKFYPLKNDLSIFEERKKMKETGSIGVRQNVDLTRSVWKWTSVIVQVINTLENCKCHEKTVVIFQPQ